MNFLQSSQVVFDEETARNIRDWLIAGRAEQLPLPNTFIMSSGRPKLDPYWGAIPFVQLDVDYIGDDGFIVRYQRGYIARGQRGESQTMHFEGNYVDVEEQSIEACKMEIDRHLREPFDLESFLQNGFPGERTVGGFRHGR